MERTVREIAESRHDQLIEICTCGHYRDTQHAPLGGGCRVRRCDCVRYRWDPKKGWKTSKTKKRR
jgi:hypothetical protein